MSYFSKVIVSAAVVFFMSGFGTSVFAAVGDSCNGPSASCGAGAYCNDSTKKCVASSLGNSCRPQESGSCGVGFECNSRTNTCVSIGGNTIMGGDGAGQIMGGDGGGGLQNPLAGQNINSVGDLLRAVLVAVVQIGFVVVTLMLVWVGFLFVTAQGNSEKLSTARTALLWTVIGGLILLGSTAISQVIQSTANTL